MRTTPAAAAVWAVLAAAILAISSSGVLVRHMAADPLAIAAWRTLGAGVLLSPALRGRPRLARRDMVALIAAGLALALHFWTWFASLSSTTILRSTLLVCTVPVWTALIEWVVRGARPGGQHVAGWALAFPGVALLAGSGGAATWRGDALAVVAAVLWAVYFLLGRGVRERVDVGATMALMCLVSAAALFPTALALGAPLTGYPTTTWVLILAAILGPQLVGHLGLVYAVRHLPAATVTSATLLEPVGAAVIAAVVLGEWPGPRALFGSALVLAGTALAARAPPRA